MLSGCAQFYLLVVSSLSFSTSTVCGSNSAIYPWFGDMANALAQQHVHSCMPDFIVDIVQPMQFSAFVLHGSLVNDFGSLCFRG